jgi:hypothetical protein
VKGKEGREWHGGRGLAALEDHPGFRKGASNEISLFDPEIEHSAIPPHPTRVVIRIELQQQAPVFITFLNLVEISAVGPLTIPGGYPLGDFSISILKPVSEKGEDLLSNPFILADIGRFVNLVLGSD